jgi:serine/threonine-protein kinase HipA
MADTTQAVARVLLWGRQIGTLIWTNDRGYFEYDPAFQTSGIEPSPIMMRVGNDSLNKQPQD